MVTDTLMRVATLTQYMRASLTLDFVIDRASCARYFTVSHTVSFKTIATVYRYTARRAGRIHEKMFAICLLSIVRIRAFVYN